MGDQIQKVTDEKINHYLEKVAALKVKAQNIGEKLQVVQNQEKPRGMKPGS